MTRPSQPMPTEESAAGTIARRILSSIGTAFPAPDGSHTAAEFLAFADCIADSYDALAVAMNQAFANAATVMLGELETVYGLTIRSDLSNAQRQTRIVAKIRAARAGVPLAILSMILPYDTTATVHENLSTDVAATDPRGVYVWAVLVTAATFNDPVKLAAIRANIEQLKPSMTLGSVTTQIGFYCDDPLSLLDQTVLR